MSDWEERALKAEAEDWEERALKAEAELARLRQWNDVYHNQMRLREDARKATERLGFKEGELQWLWRTPDCFERKYDSHEVITAICDALTREGCSAWSGDGTSCVEQMVRLQWERAERAEAQLLTNTERDQILLELDELPEYRNNITFDYTAFHSALKKLWARA